MHYKEKGVTLTAKQFMESFKVKSSTGTMKYDNSGTYITPKRYGKT